MASNTPSSPSTALLSDNPCWGSPDACSLADLLTLVSRSELILHESPDYLILNKPSDLRMDGPYAATVYKLLTYWYPPPSLQPLSQDALLDYVTNYVHQSKDVHDFELRPCHQLDYATSGVLLIARNSAAAAKAVASFEKRTVQKVYLALVHGHVHADHIVKSNHVVIQEYLDDFMKRTERVYQRSRQRQKRKPNTFAGFLPAHTLFQKWKSIRPRQNPLPESQQSHENASKRQRTTPTNASLSQEDWKEIWKTITDHLTDEEQAQLKVMDWKQVKVNGQWNAIFTKASDLYNERMRALASAVPEQSPSLTSTINNALPTVFRVKEDSDNLNRFYIYAATAEVPDQFAVQVSEESRLFLASNSETVTSNSSSSVSPSTSPNVQAEKESMQASYNTVALVYKPSLTQCTVLDHAYLDIGGTRFPVTKVRLEPKTGRRHQLRVHMAHVLGAPIVQDMTYAARPKAPTLAAAIISARNSTLASADEETNCGRGDNSGGRSLRMCLHAHAMEIALNVNQQNGNESPTPTVLTAEAPDPFPVDNKIAEGAQKLVRILHC